MKYLALLLLASCYKSPTPIATEQTPIAVFPVETEAAKPVTPKIVYTAKSSLGYIQKVALVANCVIQNEEFLKEVGAFKKFTFTDKTPLDVMNSLKGFSPVVISTYKTKNPFTKVIATTYASDKTTIYFNTRMNPRDMSSMINTAIHEGLHLSGYSHGDNSSIGKEDSVNYRVGTIAEKYTAKCEEI